jgi:hypothetical protein
MLNDGGGDDDKSYENPKISYAVMSDMYMGDSP